MDRAVFLDRDGVLNRSAIRNGQPVAPTSLEDFALLPGVTEAIARLHQADFRLIVVTNQPDIATGKISREVLDLIHQRLRSWLPVDAIKVCPHVDKDQCACRKPKPGMLLEAAREWPIDLNRSFMVGDRWRDVSAGKAAGCKTIFIDYSYRETQVDQPDFVVTSLLEASDIILRP
jgi:D-glycero-D-manno-heptose 1,7-bisphosphate phosphatase